MAPIVLLSLVGDQVGMRVLAWIDGDPHPIAGRVVHATDLPELVADLADLYAPRGATWRAADRVEADRLRQLGAADSTGAFCGARAALPWASLGRTVEVDEGARPAAGAREAQLPYPPAWRRVCAFAATFHRRRRGSPSAATGPP